MKRLLKSIIGVQGINYLLRTCLRTGNRLITRSIHFVQKYVPVSGEILLKILKYEIKLYGHSDDHLVTKSYYKGLSELNELRLFVKIIAKTKVFYDVGANVGLYSILAEKSNKKAQIYAFEPDPFINNRFLVNSEINGCTNISVFKVAIGDKRDSVKFYIPKENINTTTSSILKSQLSGFYPGMDIDEIDVAVNSIDGLIEHEKFPIPDLIKLDVECNELNAFIGMNKLIENHKPIILAELFNDKVKLKQNPKLESELVFGYTDKIQQRLDDHGYSFYLLGHSGILFVPSLEVSCDTFNYLLVPKKLNSEFYLWNEVDNLVDEIYS
ncbi:MAG: FkbM family methyltransferase [Bacteroidia bacterium]|jgi:FkbM family methyltransferase